MKKEDTVKIIVIRSLLKCQFPNTYLGQTQICAQICFSQITLHLSKGEHAQALRDLHAIRVPFVHTIA